MKFILESLESRQLLADVTVLIHGLDGSIDGWVTAVADDIAQRVGPSQVSQYVMKVGDDSKGNLAVNSFTLQHGPQLTSSTSGEAIVKVDWTDVDSGYPFTGDVADVVADYMLTAHGTMPALAQLPIHLIGHSRGASMAVAISHRLGRAGVWVDQETFLDPAPEPNILGIGDAPMTVYDNVIFADNYWRDDGDPTNLDPDGQHVDGAHEGNLDNSVQEQFVGSAHMSVPAYYDGTINFSATDDIDEPIFSSWYGSTPSKPARNATGYVFSRIGGSARPADGLIPAFGGTASRTDVSGSGAQWSNGGDLRIVGGTTFTVGQKLSTRFIYQDRDGPTNVSFVLDTDQNPYNGNEIRTMRRTTLAKTANMTIAHLSALTAGVDPGRYYIFARFTDAQGHTRYTYSRRITLTAPASTAPLFSTTTVSESPSHDKSAPITPLGSFSQLIS